MQVIFGGLLIEDFYIFELNWGVSDPGIRKKRGKRI